MFLNHAIGNENSNINITENTKKRTSITLETFNNILSILKNGKQPKDIPIDFYLVTTTIYKAINEIAKTDVQKVI